MEVWVDCKFGVGEVCARVMSEAEVADMEEAKERDTSSDRSSTVMSMAVRSEDS